MHEVGKENGHNKKIITNTSIRLYMDKKNKTYNIYYLISSRKSALTTCNRLQFPLNIRTHKHKHKAYITEWNETTTIISLDFDWQVLLWQPL